MSHGDNPLAASGIFTSMGVDSPVHSSDEEMPPMKVSEETPRTVHDNVLLRSMGVSPSEFSQPSKDGNKGKNQVKAVHDK